ncbi:MAG: HAD family hydrolase [Pseudomonadota bacterium]
MRTLKAKVFVFDVDDTLYLERTYVKSGFEALEATAWNHWRVRDFAQRAWECFEQGTRGDIFQRVLTAAGVEVSSDELAMLVDGYRRHDPRIELLDDAQACLARLPPNRCGVLTDGPSASQNAKVNALGLRERVSHVIVTADHGPGWGKPGLPGFRALEQALSSHGKDCVYFADNPLKDFEGPRALGWRTVRVRRPEGLHARRPSGNDVDLECASFAELALEAG